MTVASTLARLAIEIAICSSFLLLLSSVLTITRAHLREALRFDLNAKKAHGLKMGLRRVDPVLQPAIRK